LINSQLLYHWATSEWYVSITTRILAPRIKESTTSCDVIESRVFRRCYAYS